MNNDFTEKIKAWLEAPSSERNLEQGAMYLLQLSGNRIMYQNVSRNLKGNADIIEYQLQKYYNFRVKELTHQQVLAMQSEVDKIVSNHFSFSDDSEENGENVSTSSTSSTESASQDFKKGKREDHDSLPDEIQSCFVENLSIMQRMRELHLQLRKLSTADATCPDSERYPFLKELIKLDKQYHKNWDIYDHYVIGTPVTEVTTSSDDAVEVSKSAVRVVNLMKGKYRKNPSDELKAKILANYSKILEPSEKLTAELKELGIL